MNVQNHIIQKQVLRVTLPAVREAHLIQEQLAKLCHNKLPIVLEGVCNKLSTENTLIRLDKISLDLGTIDMASIEEEFMEKVERELSRALQSDSQRAKEYELTSTGSDEQAGAYEKKTEPDTIVPQGGMLEVLHYFLLTGILPSWINKHSFSLESMIEELIKDHPRELRQTVLPIIHNKNVSRRWANCLNNRQFKRFVRTYIAENNPAVAVLIEEIVLVLERLRTESVEHSVLELRLREWIMQLLVRPAKSLSASLVLKEFSRQLSTVSDIIAFETSLLEITGGGSVLKSKLPQLLTGLKKQKGVEELGEQKREINPGIDSKGLSKEDLARPAQSGQKSAKTSDSTDKGLLESAFDTLVDQCSIDNAGLILLVPGITTLFKDTGITKDNLFVNDQAAQRGALLLQYLITGEESTPEYDLPLNKLLCGLEITDPVNRVFLLTEKEQQAIRDLLNSVIQEWTALKNTAPEGLRNTYLRRSGSLIKKGKDWSLKVERQTEDILIDRLPWGIGITKLPWMNRMIYTEW